MKYIISQRNNLYTEDNKIYYNGKMIEYEGDFEEAVLNKKVKIIEAFYQGILIIRLFLPERVHLLA